jgi:shikimate dehydrogenase
LSCLEQVLRRYFLTSTLSFISMAVPKKYTLAGVMGWPVGHSLSPLIHNHWIAQYGLVGAYVLLPVAPEKLEVAMRALPVLGFTGCNLTIPHKVAALSWVDDVDPLTARIGAINTIAVHADGSLMGRNTDGFGFIQSLLDVRPTWRANDGPVCIVGAGGAARAAIVSLLDQGAIEIRLTNRSAAKTHDMTQEFGPAVRAIAWEDRHDALNGLALLVNTTNQGMQGQASLNLCLDQLPTSALVSDVIYTPSQTPLLAAANARGNTTVNGLGMLRCWPWCTRHSSARVCANALKQKQTSTLRPSTHQ